MNKFPIPDFPDYEVHVENDECKIWSKKKCRGVNGRYLKPCLNSRGYHRVTLYKNDKPVKCFVHRLIALACIPNPDNLSTVDHINIDHQDNRLSNLRWSNYSDQNHNQNCKGYYWDKVLKKWRAQIKVNGKLIHLGLFDKEEDARQAYLDASAKYFPGVKSLAFG